ncbi:hypothetical protein [Kineosporia succinea]|uniref:Membrane protein YesL n=1 Tax=Kineosporia succinea TaxID=84632 RepID=A0ABT9P8R6_9ACTN|nr:hypothetical protein [Kineosporia succinea]MDP9828857.1 putative membrane protein YesL [Kineosporia succinea]
MNAAGRYETWTGVIGTVWLFLSTNLFVVIAVLPFLLTASTPRLWPVLAPLWAPAAVAAFARFGGREPVSFVHHWRRSLAPALRTGAAASFVLVVLAVDAHLLRNAMPAVIPLLAVLALLVVITTLHVLVGLAEHPGLRVRDLARAGLYLGLRHWCLTGVSLLVLALLGGAVVLRPALGLGLALAPLLYVVWANCRYSLRALSGTDALRAPHRSIQRTS